MSYFSVLNRFFTDYWDPGQDGGYIFGPGCAEPLNTPIRNIQALVEVSKRHPY